jgi:uncharacterized protein YciI
MQWLKELHSDGRLRACGGWLEDEGGLTLIEADSLEEAKAIDARSPLSEIGTSEIHAWDLYYAECGYCFAQSSMEYLPAKDAQISL